MLRGWNIESCVPFYCAQRIHKHIIIEIFNYVLGRNCIYFTDKLINFQVQWRFQLTHSNFWVLHYVRAVCQPWVYVCGVIASIDAGGDNQLVSGATPQGLADVSSILVVPTEGSTCVMSWENGLPVLIVSDSRKIHENIRGFI